MPQTSIRHDAAPAPMGHDALASNADVKAKLPDLRIRAAERLAALGEMTGGIAHDFRNILAVIESGLALAEREAAKPEKVRRFIAGARQGIDRGLKLTAQLLTFAQQRELKPILCDANDLLKELDLFLKYSAGYGIGIALELTPGIPKCVTDPSQFNAAILNLVVNARDAMSNGGRIQISTQRVVIPNPTCASPTAGDYIRVRVKDSGAGMSSEVVQRIFDPFFTTKAEKGTGLGLPQVAAFMRLVGGHVSVASKPGHGSTFDLFFCSAREDAKSLVETENTNRSSGPGA
jgi:signal transduction histidine kinase